MKRDPRKHLTEEEFVGLVLEELPEHMEEEIDQHLERCVACTRQLEDFYTGQEEFPAEEWAKQRGAFVSNLREHLFGPSPLSLRERLSHALRQAQESWKALAERDEWADGLAWEAADEEEREVWDWQSPDSTLSVDAIRERNGDLTFRFASKELSFHGERFSLRFGSFERQVLLQRVSETEVGAEIVLPRRQRLSKEMSLEI